MVYGLCEMKDWAHKRP